MKKILFPLVFSALGLFTVSCNGDDDGPRPTNDPAPARDVARQGTWRITNFNDEGVDRTAEFAGFTFTFAESNVIAVDGNGQSITGSWSITTDDDYDMPEDTNLDFNIFFSSPQNFRAMNEDWDIGAYSDTRIELQDLDDDGPSEFLVFERN